MTACGPRTHRRAGPDRSAIPNLPELPPWLGALLIGGFVGAVVACTVTTIGLPFLPVPVVVAAAVIGGLAQPKAQRWLAGGSLSRRPGLRTSLAMGLFAVIGYGMGLPSIIPVFAMVVASVHLHWSGWRIWRLVAAQSLVLTVIGEMAVALDWLPSVLLPKHEHPVAGVFVAAGTQALSNLGMAARRREEIELELRRAESRFRALVQKSKDVVGIVDRDGTITYLSPAVTRLTRHDVGDLHGRRLGDLLQPSQHAALNAVLVRAAAAGSGATEEVEIMIGVGTEHARWLEIVVTNLLDDAAVRGFVLNATDVTERRRYREQLVHVATHDPLTMALNRSAFMTVLQRELADVSVSNEAWLFFCDLDGFKGINDRFGHDAGDAVLVHTAQQLRRRAGSKAVVGRFGGDEFCVMVPPGAGGAGVCRDPYELRDRLAGAVAEPCRIPNGESVRVQVSLGLVVLDGSQLLADDVLRDADQRMYQRKRRAAATR